MPRVKVSASASHRRTLAPSGGHETAADETTRSTTMTDSTPTGDNYPDEQPGREADAADQVDEQSFNPDDTADELEGGREEQPTAE
ncbi:hypothetical protein WJX64_13310 [Leifsonia sp. YIM 134122]|uniref:Uncharacterized protein n=1 Tax=Leifsonia stereocauli TaxID=3134136 RepID=A0ABU9W699_9MICO